MALGRLARQFWYKHLSNNPVPMILATGGEITVYTDLVPADRNQAGGVMDRLENELNRRSFGEKFIDRVICAAVEAIPNALAYASPASNIGILLFTYGRGPHSLTILMVDNLIDAELDPAVPPPEAIKQFQDMLLDTHGRGIPLMREMSEAMVVLVDPGQSVRTILFFTPRPGE